MTKEEAFTAMLAGLKVCHVEFPGVVLFIEKMGWVTDSLGTECTFTQFQNLPNCKPTGEEFFNIGWQIYRESLKIDKPQTFKHYLEWHAPNPMMVELGNYLKRRG
jgi:hypothetical protein